ncbi:MAG: hypothetical protein WCL25_00935 [bacterium]
MKITLIFPPSTIYGRDPILSCKDSDFEDIGIRLAGRGAQTKYFTPVQLQGFLTLAYKRFFRDGLKNYSNPLRIIVKIRNFEDLVYVVKIARIGIRIAVLSMTGKFFSSQKMWKYKKRELAN